MKTPRLETRKIRADELRPHPIAQREMVKSLFKKMCANLDLDGIGVLHVVRYTIERVLAWWILDGMHRHAALLHHGFGEWEVDVQIHHDIKDDASAAKLFLLLNERATVAPFDRFLNELTAKEEVAVETNRILVGHGFEAARGSADGRICAVAALKRLYTKNSGESLDQTLGVIREAWGRTAAAVEGHIMEGIGAVFTTHNGEVDRRSLAKKLAKYPGGPSALRGNARALSEIRKATIAKCVGEVVLEEYNRGRRSGKLGPI